MLPSLLCGTVGLCFIKLTGVAVNIYTIYIKEVGNYKPYAGMISRIAVYWYIGLQ